MVAPHITRKERKPHIPLGPHDRAVMAVIAYACTLASVRYAKDSDKAPTMAARAELLHMSAQAVAGYDQVAELADEYGVDVTDAAAVCMGQWGDVDERLRPSDWPERLIKTYLVYGLVLDFTMALTDDLPRAIREQLLDVLAHERYGAFATAQLMDDVAADPQLAARLGLWGRRVVGEEITTLSRLSAIVPNLLSGDEHVQALHQVLSAGALSRMRGLGLRV